MTKEIIQKKMEPNWDPLGNAHRCIGDLKKAVDDCDVSSATAFTGCAYGNAEAAFYEKQASEDEMVSIKEMATELRGNFSSRCKCIKR